MKKGPGFKAVAKKIAAKQGVSRERAGAILAAGARKASPAAIKANPNLKKVSGMKKKMK
jgi:cytochrome c551/c552